MEENQPASDKNREWPQAVKDLAGAWPDFPDLVEIRGESGAALSAFAGSIDSVSAQEMKQAIEQECE